MQPHQPPKAIVDMMDLEIQATIKGWWWWWWTGANNQMGGGKEVGGVNKAVGTWHNRRRSPCLEVPTLFWPLSQRNDGIAPCC